MPTPINTDRFVWCDLETFGLDPDTDPIIELGFIITDVRLDMIDDFEIQVWDTPTYDQRYIQLADSAARGNKGAQYVLDMHASSGLWASCRADGVSVPDAVENAVAWLAGHGINKGDAICGSSVPFDRAMLLAQMPAVIDPFSYRNVDVSTVKELCARFNPELYARLGEATDRKERHRALDDLDDTINELEFYRREFLLHADWTSL